MPHHGQGGFVHDVVGDDPIGQGKITGGRRVGGKPDGKAALSGLAGSGVAADVGHEATDYDGIRTSVPQVRLQSGLGEGTGEMLPDDSFAREKRDLGMEFHTGGTGAEDWSGTKTFVDDVEDG